MQQFAVCLERRQRVAGWQFAGRRFQSPERRILRVNRLPGVQFHDEERRFRAFGRVAAFTRAAREGQTQQRIGHLVPFDQLARQPAQFLRREGKADFQKIGAARQPFEMLRPTERFAVIDGYGLKHPVAVQETAVGHGDHSLLLRNELVVE